MVGNIANIAVTDLDRARRFYEDTLGLKPVATGDDELIVFQSGKTKLYVYRSRYARVNQATAATWMVGEELEGMVNALKAKGVVFEHYDMPGLTLQGDIHVSGDFKIAWFKDPDGNILCITNR